MDLACFPLVSALIPSGYIMGFIVLCSVAGVMPRPKVTAQHDGKVLLSVEQKGTPLCFEDPPLKQITFSVNKLNIVIV